jgi:hypothetical protein
MSSQAKVIFQRLDSRLPPKGWPKYVPANPTGKDLYATGKFPIKVTANVVTDTDDYVSVKLTISRENKGDEPKVFNELRMRHEASNTLSQKPRWFPLSGEKESKVEVIRSWSSFSTTSHIDWIEQNATVFRVWADEAAELQ